ncbi:type IV secretory system conjugative DNA transfer family protein [Aequorivita vladivostokensis]|uniref:Conjugal transfer protein TraG n=1 Tax=Aequorivita vladivostokensis TaxID=171194 RepID=A0ABR5DM61_9FLAO|nr:type IV secretory system conjugative DNA transfer family protein [Aequorivita vladivostokensis]KJJ39881.1 hypothetical protein MB09_01545 [Aequorivita vladivostokensis]
MKLKEFFIYCLEMLEEGVDQLSIALSKKDHTHKARFERESKLVSANNKGFCVTGTKHLSVKQSEEQMIVVSPSGGGKTTTIILPSCYNIDHSLIINDPSGEILEKTKNQFITRGFKVMTLNFGEKEGSVYYNPLHRIKNNADINKVAQMLVRSTTKDGQFDFWANKSVELIGLMINYLLSTTDKEYHHLAQVFNLLELLQGSPEKIDALFAENAPEHLWQKYKSLIGNSENTRASIISSALASLNFIGNDQTLSDLTSNDTIDFAQLRKEKTVIYLRLPLGDMSYYSTILSIFWEQFFSYIFSKLPQEDDLHISVILEELSSLHLPNLSNIFANARKFHTSILGILQSEMQLHNNYGEFNAKTILNNAATKVYFTGLTEECNQLQKILGEYSFKDEKGNKRTRSLMTSDEIRTMPKNKVLIIPSGIRPIYANIKPYYKQPQLVKLSETELPEDYKEDLPSYSAKYLDINTETIDDEVQERI